MSTRSRGGCVDCKRSKVKCDEARPSCGTCARRRLVCHGYQNTKEKQSQHKPKRSPSPHSSPRRVRRRRASNVSASTPVERIITPIAGPVSPNERNLATDDDNDYTTSSQLITSKRSSISTYRDLPSPATVMRLSEIPPGMIRPEDESTIEIYFNRHPKELVIGREFINEMNANVLMVLQHNPKAIGDCLFIVGSLYVTADEGNSIIPILDRRARIFANLRSMSELECDLEQMIVMLLGLCAMELIDTKTPTEEIQIPALLQNTAILINHHINCGKEVTSLAKYFIRALARQDMITSLTHFRRPVISTTVWLDEECRRTADRFMGYTTTMMPLLTVLSVLAEDIRGSVPMSYILDVPRGTNSFPSSQGSSLTQRAAHLSARIAAWEPTLTQGVSFRSSRKFLSQAFSYRSAALLYLHRLFHPPNSSLDADEVAVEMAYKVLVYTSNQYPEDLRMSLWPVFIAACELTSEDDRAVALEAFDAICTHRRTATSLRTKQFCIERVWKARDSGLSWNWMDLVAQYPGECLPI